MFIQFFSLIIICHILVLTNACMSSIIFVLLARIDSHFAAAETFEVLSLSP